MFADEVDAYGTLRLKPTRGGITRSIRQFPHQLLAATQISLLMASTEHQTFIELSSGSLLCSLSYNIKG